VLILNNGFVLPASAGNRIGSRFNIAHGVGQLVDLQFAIGIVFKDTSLGDEFTVLKKHPGAAGGNFKALVDNDFASWQRHEIRRFGIGHLPLTARTGYQQGNEYRASYREQLNHRIHGCIPNL
jgi:hypothetical protein